MICNGLVGHERVMKRIVSLIASGRLPHAVILTGPPGVGKSMAAKAIAAAYLCERHGCFECGVCQRVASRTHPDLHFLEIKRGKRDILIDPTRELMQSLASKAYEGGNKVAVIDPADRMNEQAQNAFLKILEEPPDGTLLVLVSSHPERLLTTVRSRCQNFRFGCLDEEQMEAFSAAPGEGDHRLPVSLAAGSPGRLQALHDASIEEPRDQLIDFFTTETTPSPVKFSHKVKAWADQADNKQEGRNRVRHILTLALSMVRDLLVLDACGEGMPLRNNDIVARLVAALPLYDTVLLTHSVEELLDTLSLIDGFVDPGLVLEEAAAVIRKARK